MSDPKNPLDWIAKAEEDYALAASSLRRKQARIYGTCYHSQQCAEKCLKALLLFKGKPFPRTHDLLKLSDLCEKAGILVPVDIEKLDALSECGAQARYPGGEPSVQDAREALDTARIVRRFARRFLNVK